jgi:hypothetical protein
MAVPYSLQAWWHEATGPLKMSWHRNTTEAVLYRIKFRLPVFAPALIAAVAAGTWICTGAQAKELTRQALASAAAGRLNEARLCLDQACALRSEDSEVLRAKELIYSGDKFSTEAKSGLPRQRQSCFGVAAARSAANPTIRRRGRRRYS